MTTEESCMRDTIEIDLLESISGVFDYRILRRRDFDSDAIYLSEPADERNSHMIFVGKLMLIFQPNQNIKVEPRNYE